MNRSLIILFIILFSACAGEQTETQETSGNSADTVRSDTNRIRSACIHDKLQRPIDSINALLKKDSIGQVMSVQVVPVSEISVRGKAYYNLSYCSGAAPPKEVLDELARPRALKNSKIMFIGQDRPEITRTAVTDKEGNFKVELDAGRWNFYLTKETDPGLGLDPDCKKWFSGSYGSLYCSGKKADTLKCLFHLGCDPCDPTVKMRP